MFHLLHSIFSPKAAPRDEAIIQAAIERVIDGTDSRLRLLSGYKKKMHAAVAGAVEYVVELVDSLPPSVEMGPANYSTDPRLKAFFVSPEHLREVIGASRAVCDHLQTTQGSPSDRVHCLLSLGRSEKHVLGMELQDGVVLRDVAQTVVNFSDHLVVAVTGSETETRRELKKRAFDHLIQMALQNLVAARGRKLELAKQRTLLQNKLSAIRAGRAGLEPLLGATDQSRPDLAAIQEQVAFIEAELLQLGADSVTLDHHLKQIVTILGNARGHLHLEHVSVTLDTMGVKRNEQAGVPTRTLFLDEAVGANRRRIVMLGHFARADVPAQRDFFQEASRYLS